MLVFKYQKVNAARFLSHLDVFKAITRAINRTNVEVEYSQGFNPHMLINLSNPIPLGIESNSEYCCINTQEKAESFLEKYVHNQQESLKILKIWETNINPNIAGKTHSARYKLSHVDFFKNLSIIDEYLQGEKVTIEYFDKGTQTVLDCKDKILNYEFIGEDIFCNLYFGNKNLRADRLAFNICNKCDIPTCSLQIIKTNSYVCVDGKILETDEYLSAL